MEASLALLGALTGSVTGRVEEQVRGDDRALQWYVALPVGLLAGLVATKCTRAGAFIAGIAGGIVINDIISYAVKTATAKRMPVGAVVTKKLPPWTTGRRAEEIMADDLKAAVYRGKNDPDVRALAIQIIKEEGLDGRQQREVAEALQKWVRQNITYVNDPHRTEVFQEARKTLYDTRGGDCDDQAVALASMLMSVGIPTKLVLMSQESPFNPKTSRFRHIFVVAIIDGKDHWVETIIPDGDYLDYRHPHTGLMYIDMTSPAITKKQIVSKEEAEQRGDLSPLSGLLGFGDDGDDASLVII